MIRVKLMLLTQQTLLHINPSHQDEPFQSILVLFYKITFEMFQTFCYLYTIGSVSVSNCCIRVPLLSQ